MEGRFANVPEYSTAMKPQAAFALLPAGCGRCMAGAAFWAPSAWAAVYEQAWQAALAGVQNARRTRYAQLTRIHPN